MYGVGVAWTVAVGWMVTVRSELGLLVGGWGGEMEMASKLRLTGVGAFVSVVAGFLRTEIRGFVVSVVLVG